MDTIERIKAICKERGIAISRLERECGFSNGYIRGLREGKIPSDRLLKVADYLGLSATYLVTGQETPKESTSGKVYYFNDETAEAAEEMFEDPELRALMNAARDCPPEVLKSAAELLKRFKETNPDG